MPDIDKLIEMALDFSDIGLDDPFDQGTHAAIVGQRVVIYLATTTKHFWDIVRNGMYGVQRSKQSDRHTSNIFFDQVEASDRAHGMAYAENNEQTNGPIKGMVLVAEKKVLRLSKPSASMVAQIAAQAGAVQTPMVDTHIQPRDIVGVVFPAEGRKWAYPIRTFVQKAKWGGWEEEGLPAPGEKITGLKFGRATIEDWQAVLLRYIQNLLNYSSNYFDYLTGDTQNNLTRSVIANSTKTGRRAMLHFTPKQMMEWVYSILPPVHPFDETHTKEDDLDQVMHATDYELRGRSFWELYDKYSDKYSYDIMTGKKEPPTPQDEE